MVGTLIAAEHPELVRTLTVTGSGFSSAGYVPGAMEDLVGLSPGDEDMEMFAAMYAQLPGRSRTLPRGVGEDAHHVGRALRLDGRVQQISAPTLVIVGDDDYISVEHAEEFSG